MAPFADVLLRGLLLVLAGIAAGGAAWTVFVLRPAAHAKPDGATRLALRATALAAVLAAATQTAVGLLVLGDVARHAGHVPFVPYVQPGFARAALARIALAVILAVLAARLSNRPAGPTAWLALSAVAVLFVGSAASLSHAAARVSDRPWL